MIYRVIVKIGDDIIQKVDFDDQIDALVFMCGINVRMNGQAHAELKTITDWLDNADSYICPKCRFECCSPLHYSKTATCPKCGFTPQRYLDKRKEMASENGDQTKEMET